MSFPREDAIMEDNAGAGPALLCELFAPLHRWSRPASAFHAVNPVSLTERFRGQTTVVRSDNPARYPAARPTP